MQDHHYHSMSNRMRAIVIKENLMLKFQTVFETFWNDPEFRFKGDKTLISTIIASL
jgi:hypothetical protein